MAWKIYDEAVEMMQRRYQYFPRVFRWRGQHHEVETIQRCWTVSRRSWRGRIERHFFLVRCASGDFELYQDVRTGMWHLRRARMASARVPDVRQIAPAWR